MFALLTAIYIKKIGSLKLTKKQREIFSTYRSFQYLSSVTQNRDFKDASRQQAGKSLKPEPCETEERICESGSEKQGKLKTASSLKKKKEALQGGV